MKIIIDTNILISAVIRDKIPEEVLLWIIENSFCNWIASIEIITEYKEVLKRPKFHLSEVLLKKWFDLLEKTIEVVESKNMIDFPRDKKDAKFLNCAESVKADVLLTGDGDFSEAQELISTKIITVNEFYNQFVK